MGYTCNVLERFSGDPLERFSGTALERFSGGCPKTRRRREGMPRTVRQVIHNPPMITHNLHTPFAVFGINSPS